VHIANVLSILLSIEPACEHIEGGSYVGPEFQLGQVYDGGPASTADTDVVLYRPVYVCVSSIRSHLKQGEMNHFAAKLTQQNSKERNSIKNAAAGGMTAASAASANPSWHQAAAVLPLFNRSTGANTATKDDNKTTSRIRRTLSIRWSPLVRRLRHGCK